MKYVSNLKNGETIFFVSDNPIKDTQTIAVKTVEDFFSETIEDYLLWDEDAKGQYQVERILKAMENFLKLIKQ